MIGMSAVIFIPDDTAKTGYPQPLMLQSVMGAPAARVAGERSVRQPVSGASFWSVTTAMSRRPARACPLRRRS